MPMVQEYVSLKPYNTFGVESAARWFARVHDEESVRSLACSSLLRENPHLILGGGSNVLFVGNVNAVVIHNECKGIDIIEEDDETILVRFAAGEVWHECVAWAMERSLGGMENLALIPGTMGAAPIQNIGAYGAEVESVIETVHAVHLGSGERLTLSREDCAFGYRDSIFKNDLKGACFITAVECRLRKRSPVNLSYGELARELEKNGTSDPDVKDVFHAVVAIRTRKLPDVRVLGNAGSFFKNPVVSANVAEALKSSHPEAPAFTAEDGVKLSAAWLIDTCGCKGLRRGDAAVYDRHALVLVNHGSATGREILDLAWEVRDRVGDRFGVELEIEVRVIDMP